MRKLNSMLKGKITLLNIISTFLLHIATIIVGFIVPKLILENFGSETNGLLSSITQFLNYITLLEGGLSGIVVANMYKPLVNNDNIQLSNVIRAANSFYRKIGVIFAIYSFILALIFPLLFSSSFSYYYIFSLVLILSINLFVQYMFSLTYRNLLNADKKIYIISFVQIIILIINVILTVIILKMFPNIHILKLVTGSLYLIQSFIYGSYIKKNYKIDYKGTKPKDIMKQRWNGFAVNIASFVHNNTDITILTIFTNLSTVSVYSVYLLVTSGLKQLITSITSSINPTIGHAYAIGDLNVLNKKLDLYEFICNYLVFFFFSVAIPLITPFVRIYTLNILDANYNQTLFGVVLLLSEAIYLLKLPHLNLAYSANKFKELTFPSFLEAFINITVSILLVNRYGLLGVAIGTLIAMTYRLIFHIYFTKKLIGRKMTIFYKKILLFLITSILGIGICIFIIPPVKIEVLSWTIHAIIYSCIITFLLLITSFLFFKKEVDYFKKYLKINDSF